VRKTIHLLAVAAAVFLAAGCGKGAGEGGLDVRLGSAWRAYSTGDFDVAINAFSDVADAVDANDAQRYSALLGLATTHHLRTGPDLAGARQAYERLAKLGTPDARKQSILGLAQIDIAEGHEADGHTKLMALMKEFPSDREADEAAIYLAASLLGPAPAPDSDAGFKPPPTGRVERGVRVLEDRLQAYPDNSLAAPMHIMLANQYIQDGQMRLAVDHLIAGEKLGIAGVKTHSIVLWQIARIAENDLKDYDLAERFYERYTQEFKRTTLYYRALKSLERVRALKAQEGA
jgi:hypothetical protein